jgi:beta-lactamase class A
MRKIAIFLFYSFFLILVGRNLSFIPQIYFEHKAQVKDSDQIRQDLITFLKTQKGQFNVYYEDLKTGDTFGINENTILTAASLNKLPIVGLLYSLASKKEINLEEPIVIQREDIQDYGTGVLRYENPGQSYTLKYLAQLTLQNSDNTAAHVLEIRLGEDNVQAYATRIGMDSTDMIDNLTTPRDIGKFFELLYQDKVTSKPLTKELLGYMENTDIEDRIPKYLPKSLHVYHKTGDAIAMIHDGGIIDDGKNPFILVVMSSNFTDENSAKDTIGQIAKIVYTARGAK